MATKAKATDFTGRQRESLQKQYVEEQATRANEMSLATAEAAYKVEHEVLDGTRPNRMETVVVEDIKKTTAEKDTVVIRVSEDIDSMTLGAGKFYSFKAGQKYEVTHAVANHLDSKGYLAARF